MPTRSATRLPGLALLGVLLVICPPITTAPAATELGLITGGEKGTYYQFGLNLQRLVKERGIDLSVHPSRGYHREHLRRVPEARDAARHRPVGRARLRGPGAVRPDAQANHQEDEDGLPEEIHVLARTGIADFDDLTDRRVAIGREGSGTYLTARLLFKVSEVQPKEMVPIDTDQALAELKAGRIEAISAGRTAMPSGSSRRSSPPTCPGWSGTATRSGRRSTSTRPSKAGSSTTAWRAFSGSRAAPPRRHPDILRRSAPEHPRQLCAATSAPRSPGGT
jgi:NMT1-like family